MSKVLPTNAGRAMLCVAGWLLHLLGIALVAGGVAIFIVVWRAGMPRANGDFAYAASRLDGERMTAMSIYSGGELGLAWGWLRTGKHLPTERVVEYVHLGHRRFLNGQGYLSVRHLASKGMVSEGVPQYEFVQIQLRWQFIVFVGLIVAALPLAAGPSRRSIFSAYLALLRPLLSLVPGRRPQPRGFEVIPHGRDAER